MNNKYFIIIIPFVLAIIFYVLTSHNENLDRRIEVSQIFYTIAISHVTRTLLQKEKIYCSPAVEFQKCLNENVNRIILTPPGNYSLAPFDLNQNQTLVVTTGTTITLADDADMPLKGGYVLGIIGKPDKPIADITLIIDGTIDGNKRVHPYERSGNECVKVDYAYNVKILGSGVVRNCSGDGIDIDVSDTIFVSGLTIMNNSGAGLHVGSGRPIKASANILAIGLTAKRNGFRHDRAGLDASWPNNNSIIYVMSHSQDNYRNWELAGAGSVSVLGTSTGGTVGDIKGGASLSHINNEIRKSKFEDVYYIYHLIRRDIAKLVGKHIPAYLDDLQYKRKRL